MSDDTARRFWDEAAATFDEEPDHGLLAPETRAAWTTLLQEFLPDRPATVLDIGCGTGSLSVVVAGRGHSVTGIDFSPAMVEKARAKASDAGLELSFEVMDAASPSLPGRTFDVILCRHVLWALPDISSVLARWTALLKPGGRLLLIEGFWHTGGGLHASELVAALPSSLPEVTVRNLNDHSIYWGKDVTDERYLVLAK